MEGGVGGFKGFGNLGGNESENNDLTGKSTDEMLQSILDGDESSFKRDVLLTMGQGYVESLVQFLVFFNTRMFIEDALSESEDPDAVKNGMDRVLISWKDMIQSKVSHRMSKTNEIFSNAMTAEAIEKLESDALAIADEAIEIVMKYARSQLIGKKDVGKELEDFIE